MKQKVYASLFSVCAVIGVLLYANDLAEPVISVASYILAGSLMAMILDSKASLEDMLKVGTALVLLAGISGYGIIKYVNVTTFAVLTGLMIGITAIVYTVKGRIQRRRYNG